MFLPGDVWAFWLFGLVVWLVVAGAFLAVLYWVIRLAVRHALQDVAEAKASRPVPGGPRTEP